MSIHRHDSPNASRSMTFTLNADCVAKPGEVLPGGATQSEDAVRRRRACSVTKTKTRVTRSAFTLIELLVVIAIIAILMSLRAAPLKVYHSGIFFGPGLARR